MKRFNTRGNLPSAQLDSKQPLKSSKTLRKKLKSRGKSEEDEEESNIKSPRNNQNDDRIFTDPDFGRNRESLIDDRDKLENAPWDQRIYQI
jgi:hypothetical protein